MVARLGLGLRACCSGSGRQRPQQRVPDIIPFPGEVAAAQQGRSLWDKGRRDVVEEQEAGPGRPRGSLIRLGP